MSMHKCFLIFSFGFLLTRCSEEEINLHPCLAGFCDNEFWIDTNVNPGSYLDENGYFTLDAFLIADRLNVSIEKVEEILFLVQKLNPPGIGARNLKECLILQIPEKKYEKHRMVLS